MTVYIAACNHRTMVCRNISGMPWDAIPLLSFRSVVPAGAAALKRGICQHLQPDLPCPTPLPKIFLFSFGANQRPIPRCPAPPNEGRVMIVTKRRVRDAVDAAALSRERTAGPAQKPVSDALACERTALLPSSPTPGRMCTYRLKPLGERRVAYGKTVWSWHPLLVSSWRR